ncbi:MAG: hypothetical protein ACJAVI_004632 [Candidatus Azotimanducaceae bacterium]
MATIYRGTLCDPWARGGVGSLSRDQLKRIGITLGIQKGLQLLYSDDAGGLRWFKNVNTAYAFKGLSPVERITQGWMTDRQYQWNSVGEVFINKMTPLQRL